MPSTLAPPAIGGRSARTRGAIIAAAIALIAERGVDDVTIEGVAARAGVGKQTVYRGWGSRTALLADALMESWAIDPPRAASGGRDAIVAWGTAVARSTASPAGFAVLRLMTMAVAADPAVAGRLESHFVVALQGHLRGMLQSMGADDSDGATDAILGGLVFRMVRGVPTGEEDVAAIVDAVLLPGIRH